MNIRRKILSDEIDAIIEEEVAQAADQYEHFVVTDRVWRRQPGGIDFLSFGTISHRVCPYTDSLVRSRRYNNRRSV